MRVVDESVRRDASIVFPGNWTALPRGEIFLLKAASREARLVLEFDTSSRALRLDCHKSALVAGGHRVQVISLGGAWKFQGISLFNTSRLLAFVDSSIPKNDECNGLRTGHEGFIVPDVDGDVCIANFERWLIGRVVRHVASVQTLLAFVRAQESYELVRFLLAERLRFRTVGELAIRYGLSESHFRRLCRQVFGCGLKHELMRWRAAAGALAFVEERRNMTDIAIGNGFATASHFSRDVKSLFGISLGRFRARSCTFESRRSHAAQASS